MSRLEQIKTNWENGHMNTSDGDWLINRVEELEDFKRSAEQLYKNYHLSAKKSLAEKEELKQQNKRYREALEEIANWDGWLIEPNPLCTVEEAYERCVDIAIEALEDEE